MNRWMDGWPACVCAFGWMVTNAFIPICDTDGRTDGGRPTHLFCSKGCGGLLYILQGCVWSCGTFILGRQAVFAYLLAVGCPPAACFFYIQDGWLPGLLCFIIRTSAHTLLTDAMC